MKAPSIRALTLAVAAVLVLGPAAGCGSSSHPAPGATLASDLPGSDAHALLASTTYRSLRVHVDYTAGLAPSPRALAFVQARLAQHLDKPDGVIVELGHEVAGPSAKVVSLAASRQVVARNRSTFASGSEASIYVVYLAGECERDVEDAETTLGWGLSATSFAVFKQTCDNAARGMSDPAQLEGAVLLHECGHLLGLVGQGTPALSAHEDLARPAHCTNPGCLMQSACLQWGLGGELSGTAGGPVDFCSACLADLRANGGR